MQNETRGERKPKPQPSPFFRLLLHAQNATPGRGVNSPAVRSLLLIGCLLFAPALAVRAEPPDAARFSAVLELGDIRQAQAWLDAGLDPDFEGQWIGTGLMIGAWEGNIPLMELFLSRGADIHKTNRFGETALMLATWKNRTEAVRWLLERGAQPNRGERTWTALHYAAFAGHAELVDRLIAAGADVNARSTNGSTALMMAAREGHAAIARRLLAAGANPALANDYGDDAVAWAMRQRHYGIAQSLAEASRFAELARQAARSPPPSPQRSQAAPDEVEELLRMARLAESRGKRSEALTIYRRALAALKAAEEKVAADKTAQPPPPAAALRALIIRAQRNAPERQSMGFAYAEGNAPDVDTLLERARAAEAAGRRREALELYRQAAARIRAGD